MQTFTSLPRALHQPTQMVDARPMLSPYVSSYQDNYRPFSQNQSPNQNYTNQYQTQSNNQANYETYYNPSILDNESFLRKNESIQKQQLSNLKAHLYDQILASLRVLKQHENIDLQIHEQLDHAKILYNKGLYLQSLRLLEKIKILTKQNNQVTYLLQVLFLEKKIESLHITRSMQDRAKQLSEEIDEVNQRLDLIAKASNLSLQLYGWYIQHGHARNDDDRAILDKMMQDPVLETIKSSTGFYEQLYRFQCMCWHSFINQDFLMHYRYSQKWVDLYEANENMKTIETAQYIKGLHNLISAIFDLRNLPKFKDTIAF